MFCPKCSQQQVSDEVRFCSRCGFQLAAVAELLTTDGVLQNFQPESAGNLSLYRQITTRVGAKVVFLSLILLPFVFMLAIFADVPELLLFPLFVFTVGLAQILYVQIFGQKNLPEKRLKQTGSLNPAEPQFKMPSAQNAPVPILKIRNLDTNEMLTPPPSVTDHTTKLLELDAELPDSKV